MKGAVPRLMMRRRRVRARANRKEKCASVDSKLFVLNCV